MTNIDIAKTQTQIATKLKKIRLEKSLRQIDVAAKAGINGNYYAKVERGEVKPSIETIERLCKALKINSSQILPF